MNPRVPSPPAEGGDFFFGRPQENAPNAALYGWTFAHFVI